jgi:hypothetical protein
LPSIIRIIKLRRMMGGAYSMNGGEEEHLQVIGRKEAARKTKT